MLYNLIGTDSSGKLRRGNIFAGVSIQSATNILIVGNMLSACTGAGGAGVEIVGGSGDVIQNNQIGHGVSGQDLGNAGDGIFAQGATGLTIGGYLMGNRIGFNEGHGVKLLGCRGCTIYDNNIGSAGSGGEPYGNWGSGIFLSGCTSNRIGGLEPGMPNEIVYNGGSGVTVLSGAANEISANHLYDNAELAIDLDADGPTANDPGDADSGANQLQNYPLLASATVELGRLTVNGALNGQPSTTLRVEFFCSWPWDPLGIPEGQVFLGTITTTTDPSGDASFTFAVNAPLWVEDSYWITATAIDPAGNTSEFSSAVPLTLGQTAPELSITAGTLTKVIFWPSEATAAGFQLEATELLNPAAWRLVTNGITAGGPMMSYIVTNTQSAPQMFFRLVRK